MTIPLFFFHPVLCESKNLSFAAAELSGSESFALISSLATKVKAFTLIQMIKEVGELKKKKSLKSSNSENLTLILCPS